MPWIPVLLHLVVSVSKHSFHGALKSLLLCESEQSSSPPTVRSAATMSLADRFRKSAARNWRPLVACTARAWPSLL
eukprot:257619-Pleurochrysis_carterae.AAC.2